MFDFEWPWMALLLPVPLLLRWLWPRPAPPPGTRPDTGQPALLHPDLSALGRSFAVRGVGATAGELLRLALLMVIWSGLVGALMRPQWLEHHEQVQSQGYDLMLALDASRSMKAMDFTVEGESVTRMGVIKGVVGRFITGRQGDRLGLVLFGDKAYTVSPLTLDAGAVRAQLENVSARMAGDGTAIGDAIGLAVKKLRERPEGSRVLILLTDGENTSGTLPPMMAARLAAAQGVRVYTIGVGSKGKVPIREDGGVKQVTMEIDEALLKNIAAETGGAYFRATDSHALEEIYRRIDSLEKTEAESVSAWMPSPLYRWPLAAALVGLLLLGLFPDGRLRTRRGIPA